MIIAASIAGTDVGIISLVVAVLSFVLAAWRLEAAQANNRITGSAPWATLLMKHIENEVQRIHEDRELFTNLCTGAFADASRKRELQSQLNATRATSRGGLNLFRALAPALAQRLIDRRAAMMNVYDSFFENDAAVLPKAQADALMARYENELRGYVDELREFALEVNLSRGSLKRRKAPGLLARVATAIKGR
jgi:hypothetical protein